MGDFLGSPRVAPLLHFSEQRKLIIWTRTNYILLFASSKQRGRTAVAGRPSNEPAGPTRSNRNEKFRSGWAREVLMLDNATKADNLDPHLSHLTF